MTIKSTLNRFRSLTYVQLENRLTLNADSGTFVCGNDLGATTDFNLGGILNEDFQYDDSGRVSTHTVTYDWNNDQIADSLSSEHFTYDANGLTTRISTENDWDADGTIDQLSSIENTFSENGIVLTSTQRFDNLDDGSSTVSYSQFDDQGQLLVQTNQNHSADGDSGDRQSWTYAEDGTVTLTTEYDYDGDGVYDETYQESFGGPNDGGGFGDGGGSGDDGSGDGGGGDLDDGSHFRSETNDVYDDQGRLISTTTTFFEGENSSPSSVQTQTWNYLDDGRIDSSSLEIDSDGDGVVDYRLVQTNQYNDQLELISVFSQTDDNGDGIFDSEYTSEINDILLYANSSNTDAPRHEFDGTSDVAKPDNFDTAEVDWRAGSWSVALGSLASGPENSDVPINSLPVPGIEIHARAGAVMVTNESPPRFENTKPTDRSGNQADEFFADFGSIDLQ